MTHAVVLGSGMAAWGAFDRLDAEGMPTRLFDKNAHPGGHTASFASPEGFVFDDGPHISFTKDERIRAMMAEAVDGEFEESGVIVDNYFEGHWVKHPAIAYLHGLPADLVKDCLVDFIDACQQPEPEPPESFWDWLVASYGATFASRFPARYGRKYHTVGPEWMNTSWLGPRLYRPSLDEVLAGALAPPADEKHYVASFRYPKQGGFASYLKPFLQRARPALGHEAVEIDPAGKRVLFANGYVEPYEHLVSSVPLPELVRMLPAPSEVQEAASRLAYSSCVTVNLGVGREDLSPAHWRYVYDEDITSVRISHPHMFSPSTVPPGHGALQVEVYYSDKYKPRDRTPEEHIPVVIDDLQRMGILTPEDRIVHRSARLIECANVIFDLEADRCRDLVHGYLAEVGIHPCGRYGDWAYHWTDESYLSGQRAAISVLG